MYTECRDYLVQTLQKVGMAKPCTSEKSLSLSRDSHVSAVLFGKDTFARNGSKRNYQNGSDRHKRRKVLDRTLSFHVIVGDFTADAVESTYEAFLSALGDGLYIDGNFVPIDIGESEWVDKDDSILQAKIAVNVEITFSGGIYKDTDFAAITDVEVQTDKEDSDGSQ